MCVLLSLLLLASVFSLGKLPLTVPSLWGPSTAARLCLGQMCLSTSHPWGTERALLGVYCKSKIRLGACLEYSFLGR